MKLDIVGLLETDLHVCIAFCGDAYTHTKLIAQRTAFGHRDLQVIHRLFFLLLIILNLRQDKGDCGRYGLREFFCLPSTNS